MCCKSYPRYNWTLPILKLITGREYDQNNLNTYLRMWFLQLGILWVNGAQFETCKLCTLRYDFNFDAYILKCAYITVSILHFARDNSIDM